MKNKLLITFEIAAVFIGTIVGAGLASGAEITQFFTRYGPISFIGIFMCALIYILFSTIIIKTSLKFKLESYNDLILLVSPGFMGKITDVLTSFFLISSSAVILAASGSLINQYFHLSKWIGVGIMTFITILVLLRETRGLIEINSIIVPSLTTVLIVVFILYITLSPDSFSIANIVKLPSSKHHWLPATFIYGAFNILFSAGVLVPICKEIKSTKLLVAGVSLGSLILTALCLMINLMLMLNVPYIYNYDIPLLYIAHRFGVGIQIALLIIIWMEMFSTIVSNVFSVSRSLSKTLNISYKKLIFCILAVAIPFSQVGFLKLISVLYPAFGLVSLIFMIQCVTFFFSKRYRC